MLDSRQLFARIPSASGTVSVVISRILPIVSGRGLRSPLLCQSGFDELLCNGARRQQIAFIPRRMTGC